MAEEIINNELVLNVPDDYKILNQQEIIIFTRHSAKNNFVIRNAEKHSAINVAWDKTNFINRHMSLTQIVSITKDTIKKANPIFKMQENVSIMINSFESAGFKYSYKTKAAENTAEYHLIKYGNNLYSFVFISRTDLYEENYAVFKDLVSNIKFKD